MTGVPNDFPSINPMPQSPGDETICGYPIRDLVIFADACRVAGVGPKELKDFAGDVETIYGAVAKSMDEHLARCLEEYLRPTKPYEIDEAEYDALTEALKKNTEKIEKKANDCYAEYRKYLQGKVKTLEEKLASLRDGEEGEEG